MAGGGPEQLDPIAAECDYELESQSGHGTFVAGVVLQKAPDAHLWIERVLDDIGVCDEHGDAYAALAGLNLLSGFRHGVKERLAGIKGCTHLTELCQVLPTAVIQALAGLVLDTREGDHAATQPPFQLDKCHALRTDGENVRTYYPRWYRAPAVSS